MKKFLKAFAVFLAVAIAAIFIFRGQISNLMEGSATKSMFVSGVNDSYDPGISTGSEFPKIHGLHNGKIIDSIDQFAGEKGTLFIANRSVDWCPYCRSQLGQLEEYADQFKAAGIGIVAITYDSPELQQPFIDAGNISYPFISDIDASSMIALGILNEQYEPGQRAYGIPYPGAFVIDTNNTIVGKIFVEGYETRVSAKTSLDYAKKALK